MSNNKKKLNQTKLSMNIKRKSSIVIVKNIKDENELTYNFYKYKIKKI